MSAAELPAASCRPASSGSSTIAGDTGRCCMLMVLLCGRVSLLVNSSPSSTSPAAAAADSVAAAVASEAAACSHAAAACGCMQLLPALMLPACPVSPAWPVLLLPLKLVAPVSSDQPGDHCSCEASSPGSSSSPCLAGCPHVVATWRLCGVLSCCCIGCCLGGCTCCGWLGASQLTGCTAPDKLPVRLSPELAVHSPCSSAVP